MANQDKTDFRWNGKLAWAPDLLYYEKTNVDVVHVPYSRTHRNSSFFLQTRLGYICEGSLYVQIIESLWASTAHEITDIAIIWDNECDKGKNGKLYVMVADIGRTKKSIMMCNIIDWCIEPKYWSGSDKWRFIKSNMNVSPCDNWKFFKTKYVKWNASKVFKNSGSTDIEWTGIQINTLEWGKYNGYFSDKAVESWEKEFDVTTVTKWKYLLVYQSSNWIWDWYDWQVRLITWIDKESGRITVSSAWNSLTYWAGKVEETIMTEWELQGKNVSYRIYEEWWEVVGFTSESGIYLINDEWWELYNPTTTWWWANDNYINAVAESWGRIFVLYSNWYVWYSTTGEYNKFELIESMDAWTWKTSLYAFRDFVIALWTNSTSIWVPDSESNYYHMYEQSHVIGLKSRYSYGEHNNNFIFVSNDNRLMALWIWDSAGRYMMQYEDIWQEIINSKLATMLPTDEAYIVDYDNELRVIVQTKSTPFEVDDNNSQTHIYKYDNTFKVWTEDHLSNILMIWYKEWIWYWVWWLYFRWLTEVVRDSEWKVVNYNHDDEWLEWEAIDFRQPIEVTKPKYPPQPVIAKVSAFLMENETNGLSGSNASQPDLFSLAKLNRLIVTLWHGKYTNDNTFVRVTSYREWVWVVQEIKNIEWNTWVKLVTAAYKNWEGYSEQEIETLKERKKCLLNILKSSQTEYTTECLWTKQIQSLIPTLPLCEHGRERFLLPDHSICIDDTMYQLAPTMPLTINLGTSQSYSSQIKVEILSYPWDIMNFWWFQAELFTAPVWVKGADWENLWTQQSSC